jgi:hypothetical protein
MENNKMKNITKKQMNNIRMRKMKKTNCKIGFIEDDTLFDMNFKIEFTLREALIHFYYGFVLGQVKKENKFYVNKLKSNEMFINFLREQIREEESGNIIQLDDKIKNGKTYWICGIPND